MGTAFVAKSILLFSRKTTADSMPKIPECDRCQYFINSPYLVCGVNPCGPKGNTCDDFAPHADAGGATERNPLGGGYAGDWIPKPFPTMSAEEQLALLDWHPQFTGRCPNCEIPISATEDSQWTCPHCQWHEQLENPLAAN